MNIFQNSVLNKYLKTQDEKKIDEAYSQLITYFHNVEIQQNIRKSKEEQFQEGFLREFFVKILGYTLNPEPNFNLTTELKNEKGAKKTDGAILKNGKALAVIELKGMDTKDLDKVNNQAFNYKNNHTDCIYVITSNFEKLRFFIHDAVAHIEFNLFTLTKEEFEILWLCLNAENLLGGVPAKIKQDSIVVEENITKKLYKDYSTFKNELWQNICKNRPDLDKLLLFQKTQKLLDRFLFVFFAEDSGLLPPNSISSMVKRYEQLIELDAKKPLYDIFKQFFDYINKGRKGKTVHDDIFAYNGGLFLPDELLDGLIIDDELLEPHVLTMTAYNFQSDVDVNILGHIFENSLNEIESVTAQLEGQKVDKNKSKRKKDGVFYTPKYITKYIVENTVGKLCEERKAEFGIVDEEYAKGRKRRRKKLVQNLYDNLQEYRNWLLEITICDPACGSGAFLNQALEFLISEHAYVDELQANLLESSIVFQDVSNHVLERNIFGVDINEESVDIAKLSLWLRTAQRGRKLTSLNNNIKCGNSLIDDPKVAGKKAFNWEEEFPQVFGKGGFDVVIGNPPYVDNRGFDKIVLNYLFNEYVNSFQKSGTDKFKTTKLNLIAPFIELNSKILKNKGLTSFIFHKNIFKTNGYTSIRKYILENFYIELLTDWGAGQFQDVIAETATFTLKKSKKLNQNIKVEFFNLFNKTNENWQSQTVFLKSYEYIFGIYASKEDRKILDKIEKTKKQLGDLVNINNGIVTGNDKKYLSPEKLNNNYKKALRGRDISRYGSLIVNEYINYQRDELLRARDEKIFKNLEKLIMQMININFVITYDEEQFYNLGTTYAITKKEEGSLINILGLLNSKLIGYYYKKKYTNDSSLTNAISTQNLITIPVITQIGEKFSKLITHILDLNKELQTEKNNFLNTLQEEKGIEKITKKLDTFYNLEYDVFKKELAKQKVKISLGSENNEWREYFNTTTQKINELQTQINQTDKEIDKMVYELYELTPEEIEIVENSVK
ncbi:TaqI-like C-terminal specificity domain-containing protein [Thiotrichales bacterium HSG1]|nr:TaqI-like C-terminal specificity domain-containing protein [Thiotrichales bacterium HSG1]